MQILGFGCDDGYHGNWIEGFLALAAEQTPPMGGGETKVIGIPVNNPEIKAIGGAFFQADGRAAVPASRVQQTATIDHLLSKGVTTPVVLSSYAANRMEYA
jgi:hypothetical protein